MDHMFAVYVLGGLLRAYYKSESYVIVTVYDAQGICSWNKPAAII